VNSALKKSFSEERGVAVLIAQRVIASKASRNSRLNEGQMKATPPSPRCRRSDAEGQEEASRRGGPRLDHLGHQLPPATRRSASQPGARWAQAAMIGLGLALAQPRRRVLVITGDGEMLMGLGALANYRRAAAEEPHHRGSRQRTLRRDRHAGDAYRERCGPRRRCESLRFQEHRD